MTKFVHNNFTIECDSAEVISRKIMPGVYVDFESIGKCLTYKCSRNSEATILKELDPKERKINEYSALDLNSKLECEKLFVAIERKKPYRITKVNHSHRHNAQTFTTDAFTYAKITQQLVNIPLLDPEQPICLIENKQK
ncbi:hypothetical protein OK18_14570 [Chryseobacterium gallinarum]|uniref:Uncharacterized protein n=1 Tax=Chryseobacterium gallinarum TaxID=1324352 RepID=A0A0G3M9G0_CHRGL|nr:hypothetical protein [Chryseobacterium gallinarum]AKK73662.1 hypothetical protein OK18_14570 [Chryseobacterium gallinarum]